MEIRCACAALLLRHFRLFTYTFAHSPQLKLHAKERLRSATAGCKNQCAGEQRQSRREARASIACKHLSFVCPTVLCFRVARGILDRPRAIEQRPSALKLSSNLIHVHRGDALEHLEHLECDRQPGPRGACLNIVVGRPSERFQGGIGVSKGPLPNGPWNALTARLEFSCARYTFAPLL